MNMRRLLKDINDMQARGNLMWDSAMAENGILKVGRLTDFQAHQIEHQLGAYTDCNHGQGLVVIHPAYYRHILKDAEEKFARFGQEVFGVKTAQEGLEVLTAFIRECCWSRSTWKNTPISVWTRRKSGWCPCTQTRLWQTGSISRPGTWRMCR